MIASLIALAGLAATAKPRVLPSHFEAGLVYVTPQLDDGTTLKFYTDTGGGLFIAADALAKAGIATPPAPDHADSDGPPSVSLPRFRSEASIPSPLANDGRIAVLPAGQAHQAPFVADGMLGQAWFGGRVWTFDYPHARVVLEADGWHADADAKRVALGFRAGANGAREADFPRVEIRVDGRPIDVLLDTGAMTALTKTGLDAVADHGPALRATSMIVKSVFDAWHAKHPDWRLVEDAQQKTHASMIEVPAVEIVGVEVGPVWFTERPDANFHDYMSQWMDRRVEGAIGGNALSHFVMTLDYPGAAAYFRCEQRCGVRPPPAP